MNLMSVISPDNMFIGIGLRMYPWLLSMLYYHLIDTMACKVLIIDTFCEILENRDSYLHME
jgi:hypothetical protein